MTFLNGRIFIPFDSLSSNSRNLEVLPHCNFKTALSLAIIGSMITAALEFINNARIHENRNFIFNMKK